MYTGMSATQFAALLAPLPPAQQIVLIEMLLQRERLVSASLKRDGVNERSVRPEQ
jgi:hypothetical protein